MKVLVTGGSKGIGKAIVDKLKDNYEVTSISRSEGYDLTKPEDLVKVKQLAKDCDILINNAGGVGSNPNEWRLALYKNYVIMAELIESYLTREKAFGRVITISSIYGKEKGHNPGFTASKAAQIAFMKCLSGRYNKITFNTICPGHIDVGKEFPDKVNSLGKPEDVANLVEFLCSDKASHIDGAVITCDGGESYSF